MPWLSLAFDDPKNEELRTKFEVRGIPRLVILEAKTGFPFTQRGRKDLQDDVKAVFNSWEKLLELEKVRAVHRAQEDAIAEGERLEREYLEKKKKEAEKLKEEGGGVPEVKADIA